MSDDGKPTAEDRGVYRRGATVDVRAIHQVDLAVFGEGFAYPYHTLRQLFDLFGELSVVVLDDGEIVGYALISPVNGEDADSGTAWLLGLAVVPESRGQGYGIGLLACALDLCQEAGIRTLKTTARPTNAAARQLFERAGFRSVFDDGASYFGSGEPREVLRLELLPE